MNEGYNIIQYVIPENSKVEFSILSHVRDVILKLLSGVADLRIKDREVRLPLQQEFPIPVWECLIPCLKTRTATNFFVQGNHYVYFSIHKNNIENALFRVFSSGISFSFVLEKDIQLQIFPIEYTEEDGYIRVRSTRGNPEVYGNKLSFNAMYFFPPYFPILIKSSDAESYSVHVQGLDRKIRLSILDKNHDIRMKAVKDNLSAQCSFVKKHKGASPSVLVMGAKNVGKSTFCQLLVSDALQNRITPVYVDLNVQRNLSIPGAISLTEIVGRILSTLKISYETQTLLHFGSVIFHSVNIELYYFLLRKMGQLLSLYRKDNDKDYFIIIDTDGSQCDNIQTTECILKSFPVDFVVVIGDQPYYENLKHSVLEGIPSGLVPKPLNMEVRDDYYEARYYQYIIRKYFNKYSIVKPVEQYVHTIKFNCFTIYRILSPTNCRNKNNVEMYDFKVEPIACNPGIIDHLLAVPKVKSVELLSITEVKYYVCFTSIDMDAKTACVLVPEFEIFDGGILLLGHVLRIDTLAK